MSGRNKLLLARSQAYSMENMEAHGAEGLSTEYIGSLTQGNRIYDYYQDQTGGYWYKVRIYQIDGTAVSEKEYIFGSRRRRRRA